MKAVKDGKAWAIDGKIKINGSFKHVHRRGFRTQGEAKAEIERIEKESRQGSQPSFTVVEARDAFMAMRRNEVAGSTFLNHEVPMMDQRIMPFFSGPCGKAITQSSVSRFYLSVVGLPYGTDHKNKILLIFQRFIEFMYKTAAISPDQFSMASFACPKIKEEVKPPKKRRCFTDAEAAAFMATCQWRTRDWVMFTLLFSTGLRVGEFLALTPSDFESGSCSFYVSKQMVYERKGKPIVIGRLKSSNSYRRVFIKQSVFDEIMLWCSDMGVGPNDTLFGLNRSAFARAFRKHVRLAALGDGLSCHSVRHYVAVRLSAQCHSIADHEAVAAMMGHTPSVDLNVYASHIDVDKLREMIGKA